MSDTTKQTIVLKKQQIEEINLQSVNLKENDGFILKQDEKNKEEITISKTVKFDRTISIRGTGCWQGDKCSFDYIGHIWDGKDTMLKNCLNKINEDCEDYTITVYLTSGILKGLNDERLKDSEFVKSDIKDKIYRAYDIDIDTTKIIVNY